MPLWPQYLHGPTKTKTSGGKQADVVYFPACITRMMGASDDHKLSLPEVFLSLAAKANILVEKPEQLSGFCCGQAFSSKGFQQAASQTMNTTISKLWELTRNGALPVVLDVTSCSHTLMTCRPFLTKDNAAKLDGMKIFDSIQYAKDVLLPRLKISRRKNSVVLHPVCTLSKMGLEKTFKDLAGKCAEHVAVPVHAGCCGMAGDRGFFFPELTDAATCEEAREVKAQSYDGYYSSAKTCEISISGATQKNYESILYLLDEVSE